MTIQDGSIQQEGRRTNSLLVVVRYERTRRDGGSAGRYGMGRAGRRDDTGRYGTALRDGASREGRRTNSLLVVALQKEQHGAW